MATLQRIDCSVLCPRLTPVLTSLDILHVVGRVEANPAILPPLAPALLILVLQLFKLVPCNIICVIDCNIVVT